MEIFKLVKKDGGGYQQDSATKNNTFEIIHAALQDGGLDFAFISDWIRNSQYSTLCSNMCAFVKVGDRIFITRNDIESEELDCYFDISQASFLDLVDQWRKINEKHPEEIIITNSGGDLSIDCVG